MQSNFADYREHILIPNDILSALFTFKQDLNAGTEMTSFNHVMI